eukprot:CAMPEP_0113711874 /NCGR_PEP_ID=MMETSP0038_2-20120614/31033_1 /TAXON_ID=2898 /ORGANISM="Cryptomonas paramecium" /LENGTH=95 /DNA_ID=CAMNT_0000638247 /DNA_START=175 /DNA_END=463 /DNA_ORIENTATION=- /assembly_acc=CAM_ASM_000170
MKKGVQAVAKEEQPRGGQQSGLEFDIPSDAAETGKRDERAGGKPQAKHRRLFVVPLPGLPTMWRFGGGGVRHPGSEYSLPLLLLCLAVTDAVKLV